MSIANVPALMEQTQRAIDESFAHPVEIAAKFHKYFIYLHPFPDGNGRLGRLLSNFILAKLHHPIIIITAGQKETYIDALKATHKHKDPDIISAFFIKTSINRMNDELLQIKTNAAQEASENSGKPTRGLSFIF